MRRLEDFYGVKVYNSYGLPEIETCVSCSASVNRITHGLRSELPFTPKVEPVEPDSLPGSDGKGLRLIDRGII